jgi:predicted nucleic acid-binding protein
LTIAAYLLDMDCLSAVSPVAGDGADVFRRWIAANGKRLFLSPVSLAEVACGITRLIHRGAVRKAALLQAWSDDVLAFHEARILVLDAAIGRRTGQLLATAQAQGVQPSFEDAAIAATAEHHGLTVLTRNLRHFVPMGVACLDPIVELPD